MLRVFDLGRALPRIGKRSQCRYFNVEKLIDWAQKLLNCPIETLFKLAQTDKPEILNQILITKFG